MLHVIFLSGSYISSAIRSGGRGATNQVPVTVAVSFLPVACLTLACILFVLAPRLDETPVRVLLGLLLVLFLPGYSLVAALFPRKGDLDGTRTIALSFGLSIAVVPGHALVVHECE